MSLAELIDQVSFTLVWFLIVLAGGWACLVLGMRVERDQWQRDVANGHLVVVPDEYELEEILEPYTRLRELEP